jgi:hypothetical protein
MRCLRVLSVSIIMVSAPSQAQVGFRSQPGIVQRFPTPNPFPNDLLIWDRIFHPNDRYESTSAPSDSRPSYPRAPKKVGDRVGIFAVSSDLNLAHEQETKLVHLFDQLRKDVRSIFRKSHGRLTEETRTRLAELAAGQNSQVVSILTVDQRKRYRQLTLQQIGLRALPQKDSADEMNLTDEQRARIQTIIAGERSRFSFGGSRDARWAEMEAMRDRLDEKILQVLTDDQKRQWQEMLGAPYNFPAPGTASTAN